MKTEHKLIAGVVVLAALGGGVYLTRAGDKAELEAHSASGKAALPELKIDKDTAEAVTKIELTNKDKGQVVLEKKGDEWRVTKPVDAVANDANVKSLIDNLSKLELTTQIAQGTEAYEKYDLQGDKALHFVAYKGDAKIAELYLGKSGTRGQMARVGDQEGVYIIKGYSSYVYARDLKGWRKTDIWKFEDKNAVAVEIENKHGKYSFSQNDDKWSASFFERGEDGKLAATAKPWEKFDEKKVQDMLRAYKALRAEDFAEAGAETGLDQAATEGGLVRIKLKDDAGDKVIKVGKVSKGSSRFASEEGGDTVYVLSSWTADWAVAEPSKFEKKDEKKDDKGEGDKAEPGDLGDLGMGDMGDPHAGHDDE